MTKYKLANKHITFHILQENKKFKEKNNLKFKSTNLPAWH